MVDGPSNSNNRSDNICDNIRAAVLLLFREGLKMWIKKYLFLLVVFLCVSVALAMPTEEVCNSCWDDAYCNQAECEALGCEFCSIMNCDVSCDSTGEEGSSCDQDGECNSGLYCSGVGNVLKN